MVKIWYDPDMCHTEAPHEGNGPYTLNWAAGWYCVSVENIPSTPPDRCREYAFSFSWSPDNLDGSSTTRGCLSYPIHPRVLPTMCFMSPAPDSIGAQQSITVVGRERLPSGAETEVLRRNLSIEFRDGTPPCGR
jgi:hypothetical protein